MNIMKWKTYNNEMSTNDDEVNENNLVYDNMSKTIKYNLEYLNRIVKNVKCANKSKAESLNKLYADRKNSQVTTAEQNKYFIGYPDANDRRKKAIDGNMANLLIHIRILKK